MANIIKPRNPVYLVSNKKTMPLDGQPMSEAQIKEAIEQVISVTPAAEADEGDEMEIMSVIAPPEGNELALAEEGEPDSTIVTAKLTEAAADNLRNRHANLLVELDEDIEMLDTGGLLRMHGLTTMVPLDADSLRIRIKVVDADGKAIPKARVSLGGEMWFDQALTGNNGVAELNMLGETLESLNSLTIKPAAGFWSRTIARPDLVSGTGAAATNVITLLSLAEGTGGLPGFPEEQGTPWGMQDLNVTNHPEDPPLVRLAIIDSGIDNDHPDLAHATRGKAFAIGDDPDDDTFNLDSSGHGTHVAGTAAGQAANAFGVQGVAPKAELHGLRVFPQAKISKLIKALRYCRENEIDVVNMSLGMASPSQLLNDEIDRCFESGVVMIAAAGNSGGKVNYPAAFDNVIAVAALGRADRFPENSTNSAAVTDDTDPDDVYFIARFSCRGPEIDVAAPGVGVISTYPSDHPVPFAELSGTSMASPHVAGFTARLLQHNAELRDMARNDARSSAIRDALFEACRPLGDAQLWGRGIPDWSKLNLGSEPSAPDAGGNVDRLVAKLTDALDLAKALT